MMAGSGGDVNHGTLLAIAIVLLWFAGACFFVAFLSGKVASMTQGSDSSGKPIGPTDASSLLSRIATNVQALQGTGTIAGGTNDDGTVSA